MVSPDVKHILVQHTSAWARQMIEPMGQVSDAVNRLFGAPTRAEREMQQRAERHMARCAMRRKRRRRGR